MQKERVAINVLDIVILFVVFVVKQVIIIIMVIFKSYISREHIALTYEKLCEHGIRKNQQIKSTAHDGKSYLK